MMPAVSMREVCVSYGTKPALDRIDVDIRPGERVALVGPSGAGKSSLLGLCNATVVPTAGDVAILGQNMPVATGRDARRLGRRIGTIRQHLDLVGPLRVVHNVNAGHLGRWTTRAALWSLVRPHRNADARVALARLGIADKIFERTEHLSGGEQQRVALARVMIQQPDLILADEPVASLDPAHAEEVMDLLCEVVVDRERTLLVSLHDFELARRRCDRLIGLRGGVIVFDCPAEQVTDTMGRDLYRLDR